MSDNVEDLMESMKRNDSWLRVVFMIAFSGLLYIIIAPVIFVLMLAQFAFVLTGGETNDNLSDFSNSLIQYISSILRFLTYESEEKPFPFSDFPSPADKNDAAGQEEGGQVAQEIATEAAGTNVAASKSKAGTKESSARKSPVKKAPKKKSAAKKNDASKASTTKSAKKGGSTEDKAGSGDEK